MAKKVVKLYGVDLEGIDKIESEENMMDEEKYIEEDVREENDNNDNNFNDEKKKKSSKLKIRFAAAGLAIVLGGCSLVYTARNNIKIACKSVSVIEDFIKKDNTVNSDESIDVVDDTIKQLDKINTYLELSKQLDRIYNKYDKKITNLDLGEVDLTSNGFVEISEDELNQLCSDIDYINSTLEEDDVFYQTVKNVVSKSSYVNAFLAYYANDIIFNSIMNNFTNDVASELGLDFSRVSLTYEAETNNVSCIRNDNGNGEASYSIDMCGMAVTNLEKVMSYSYDELVDIENYLDSDAQSLYSDKNCLMTRTDNGNYIVYRNNSNNLSLMQQSADGII